MNGVSRVEPTNPDFQASFDTLRESRVWRRLPWPFLMLLAHNIAVMGPQLGLADVRQATMSYMKVAESKGTLKRVRRYIETAKPSTGLTLLSSALNSVANHLGNQGKFDAAKTYAMCTILGCPSHIPSWLTLAVASAETHDTALLRAAQVVIEGLEPENEPDPEVRQMMAAAKEFMASLAH